MDTLIIFGAKYLIVISALVALTVLWTVPQKDRVRFTLLTVLSLPIAYVIAKIGAHFYFDPRPFVVGNFTPLVPHGPDNGFPSDHTLLAAALAAVVTIMRPRVGAVLWIFAILIGICRVLAGVHHVIDIIGAVIVAIVAVYSTFALLKMRLPRALRE